MRAKKLLILVMVLGSVLLLAGCGKKQAEPGIVQAPETAVTAEHTDSPSKAPTVAVTEAPTEVQTETATETPTEAQIETRSGTLAEKLCGSYLYQSSQSDEEEYFIELRYINERLVAEVNYQMDFDSVYSRHMAELKPESKEILESTTDTKVCLTSREFSGFSMGGEYWDEESAIELEVVDEGLLYRTDGGSGTKLLSRMEDAPAMHDVGLLKEYLGQIADVPLVDVENLEETGILGEWYASATMNGKKETSYLNFGEDGLMWLMRKTEGEPMELYRGAYGVADGKNHEAIYVAAERSGYPYSPAFGVWNQVLALSGAEAERSLKLYDSEESMPLEICRTEEDVLEFLREKGAAERTGQEEYMEGEIFVGSIKVKLPESWRENLYYEIEYNPNNTSSVIRFYEEPDHSDFGGGWLCSVIQMEGNNIEDYRHLPSFKYIGQIECPDGTIYGLIVEYPTDVQPSIEQMPRYFQMYDDIEQFIAGIEPLDVAELYYYVGGVGEYILPFSDIYKLNDSDLEELTEEELMVARNEIYARHGRLFKNPDLQEYFNARPWYNGQISSEAFDERVLSEVEKWNLQAIVSYEKTGSVGSGE